MFKKKTLKKFHVSTSRVYFVGKKGFLKRFFTGAYVKRAVYRSPGTLMAL